MKTNCIENRIVKHNDGTYSIVHLSGKELNIISSALTHNWVCLKAQKNKEGKLNAFAAESLAFSNEFPDQIIKALYR